jgi:diguanylate cyclase (GGDEF)-like protein
MLVMLLVAALASIVGTRSLVDAVSGPARQLRLESLKVLALRADVVNHEQSGHIVLGGVPIDETSYLTQQDVIAREFDSTARLFARSKALAATVEKAHQSWQQGLETYHLWGKAMQTPTRADDDANRAFGASSDNTLALLDSLVVPSLHLMDRGLKRGEALERVLIMVLAALFALATGVTVYFRRRMAKDLVRPIEQLHQGVLRLQAGHFGDRIAVSRHDELGQLAAAFNAMAADLQRSHAELTVRANRDELTGLANRATFLSAVTSLLDAGGHRKGRPDSVLFVDIDDFKLVNDSVGHEGGDALLVDLAERFATCVRSQDLVARLGGDEFAIMVADDQTGSAAVRVAERILEAVRAPFVINGKPMSVTVSVGLAERLDQDVDAAGLLRQADLAMYVAKGTGKDRWQRFAGGGDGAALVGDLPEPVSPT